MGEIVSLKKRRDFVRITNHGYKFVAQGLILQAIAGPNPDEVRLGFTVTKRLGCAVLRNRIRRRLREACRLQLPKCALKGYDYVFVGRKGTVDRPFDLLQGDVKYVVRQLEKRLIMKGILSENFDAAIDE